MENHRNRGLQYLVKNKANKTLPDWPYMRTYEHKEMRFRSSTFRWGERTYLMGIINVTPDSFSGDGIHKNVEEVVSFARALVEAGADCIDIGGESSRPNAEAITEEVELERVLPAVKAICDAVKVPVSIDTRRSSVAKEAIDLGAEIINDIYGLQGDPDMAAICARSGAAVVLMHNQRNYESSTVQKSLDAGWAESLKLAKKAEIKKNRIILDPGFGFGWLPEENLEILSTFHKFQSYQLPLLLGPSRKSTLGIVLGDLPTEERLEGTVAASVLAVGGGADIVRVHDVVEVSRALKVADSVVRGS